MDVSLPLPLYPLSKKKINLPNTRGVGMIIFHREEFWLRERKWPAKATGMESGRTQA